MAGSDRVLTRTIQSEPRVETRKPSMRAKWRSSMSACRSVAQNVLDTADIVRDRDFSTIIVQTRYSSAHFAGPTLRQYKIEPSTNGSLDDAPATLRRVCRYTYRVSRSSLGANL